MPRRVLQGTVVSDKGDKTITVLVERRVMSSDLQKIYSSSRRSTLLMTKRIPAKIGDEVEIIECAVRSASAKALDALVDAAEASKTAATKQPCKRGGGCCAALVRRIDLPLPCQQDGLKRLG